MKPSERIAWDYCELEHGFDDPCQKCKSLARAIQAAEREAWDAARDNSAIWGDKWKTYEDWRANEIHTKQP